MAVLVGREAPDFTVPAAMPDGTIRDRFNFREATHDKYALVFFYPLDFTFVCPSELIAVDHAYEDFKNKNIEIVGVSIDSHYSHHAWRNTPVDKGGIGPVRFPLAADINHTICRSYGVEHPTVGVAFRAAFIIDKQGIVRSEIVNDLPLGRSIPEILRLFDALQFHEQHGEVCPANWKKGAAAIVPSTQGIANYLSEHCGEL